MNLFLSVIRNAALPAFVVKTVFALLSGALLLLVYIGLRHWNRTRYVRRRLGRTFTLRARWPEIISGEMPLEAWRLEALDAEIVESILLDDIENASADQLPTLLDSLRNSGLIDLWICQARTERGVRQRAALLALGRTRSVDVIPALAGALESKALEIRIAAIRGLGRIACAEAATPILDRLLYGPPIQVPDYLLKNALLNCCRDCPGALLNYLERSQGQVRELLARVTGEVANADLAEALLVLAADPLPEVRASAAKALGTTNASYTLPALHSLANDTEWFVRLRAVVALGQVANLGKIGILLHSLVDSNRHVRQRAAWALTQIEPQLDQILQDVVATLDSSALQVFISEMERSQAIEKVTHALETGSASELADTAFLENIAAARKRVETSSKTSAKAAAN
jgi:HEAT repeat protein